MTMTTAIMPPNNTLVNSPRDTDSNFASSPEENPESPYSSSLSDQNDDFIMSYDLGDHLFLDPKLESLEAENALFFMTHNPSTTDGFHTPENSPSPPSAHGENIDQLLSQSSGAAAQQPQHMSFATNGSQNTVSFSDVMLPPQQQQNGSVAGASQSEAASSGLLSGFNNVGFLFVFLFNFGNFTMFCQYF
ncbi:hypothetical protein BC937DRAFT_87674 [Endogone sp. FLAS-F59071]|nr:hypothetical protein BC937DRAFT_87674 [Endogone sp. FLAS-F59071]|eukprot:RUS12514.1 hypothetical protein BC937DRAFT_87674 [Endogone sp. FLAS-F59071]